MESKISSGSWSTVNEYTVTKRADISSIDHNESIVPIRFRSFFGIDDMPTNLSRYITLYIDDKEIRGTLVHRHRMHKGKPVKGSYTKINWDPYLGDLLKRNFKHYPDFDSDDVPILVFERVDESYFILSIKSSTEFTEEELMFEDYRDDFYESFEDGKKSKIYVTRYERNPRNRENAINAHGRRCMVCDFDFGENYGSHGVDFIEVHHRVPVSSYEGEMEIDPVQDLVCLCSNCHRMIHRKRNNTLSVEKLQEYYDKAQEKKRKNQL